MKLTLMLLWVVVGGGVCYNSSESYSVLDYPDLSTYDEAIQGGYFSLYMAIIIIVGYILRLIMRRIKQQQNSADSTNTTHPNRRPESV